MDSSAQRINVLPRLPAAALLCLIVVGGLLGVTANIAKLAVAEGVPPLVFLFWATFGSGAALQILAIVSGHAPPLRRRTFEYAFWSGLLFVLPNALAFSAIEHVGAGFIALNFAFPSLFTYGLALALRLEPFRQGRALGVLAGLAGAVLLASSKMMAPEPATIWLAAAMAVPLFIALGNIYRTLRWPAGASSLSLAPLMLLGGSLITLLMLLSLGQGPRSVIPPTMSGAYLVMAQTAIFSVMYALYFLLQKIAGPVYLSQIGSVGAVAGASIAIGVLGEATPGNLAPAAVLIAIGTALVNRTR